MSPSNNNTNVSRGYIPEPQPSITYKTRHEKLNGGSARNPTVIPVWAVYELTRDDAHCVAYTTSHHEAEALKAKLERCTSYDDAVNSHNKELT